MIKMINLNHDNNFNNKSINFDQAQVIDCFWASKNPWIDAKKKLNTLNSSTSQKNKVHKWETCHNHYNTGFA